MTNDVTKIKIHFFWMRNIWMNENEMRIMIVNLKDGRSWMFIMCEGLLEVDRLQVFCFHSHLLHVCFEHGSSSRLLIAEGLLMVNVRNTSAIKECWSCVVWRMKVNYSFISSAYKFDCFVIEMSRPSWKFMYKSLHIWHFRLQPLVHFLWKSYTCVNNVKPNCYQDAIVRAYWGN
jgi:hypothetical protein